MDAGMDDKLSLVEEDMNDDNDDDDDNNNNMVLDDAELERDNVVTNVTNKINLLQAEEKLQELQQYVKYSGAPNELINCLLSIDKELRAHNTPKPRYNPTLHHWLTKKKYKMNYSIYNYFVCILNLNL